MNKVRLNKKNTGKLCIFILAVFLIFSLTFYLSSCKKYLEKKGEVAEERVEVELKIEEGMTLREVSKLLEEKGVIDSSFFFRLYVEQKGKAESLIPGKYKFKTGSDYESVLDEITSGPQVVTYKFVIPEGYIVEQIVRRVADELPFIEYSDLLEAIDINNYNYDFLKNVTSLEGFLFPKTYEVNIDYSAKNIIEMMLAQYRFEIGVLDYSFAEEHNLSPYEILIIASMIEREAYIAEERELISAVIHNRLEIDMLLQIDATLTYDLGKWDEGINDSDKEIDSSYNTYIYTGLPPTPISNPGLACIKAALDPADEDYLYYLVDDPEKHSHSFSYTLEEHNEKLQNNSN